MRSVLHNGNDIIVRILPQNANCNATMMNILHNIAYGKQQCTNAFIYMYNVNAITVSIQPQSAERNATIRLILCTTLLMISNNAQTRVYHEIGIAKC